MSATVSAKKRAYWVAPPVAGLGAPAAGALVAGAVAGAAEDAPEADSPAPTVKSLLAITFPLASLTSSVQLPGMPETVLRLKVRKEAEATLSGTLLISSPLRFHTWVICVGWLAPV